MATNSMATANAKGEAEWAGHKETLQLLYLFQGKTLSEIRQFMATMHGFHKT
jgi:hypothetical protein